MNLSSHLIEAGDPAQDSRAFRRCLGQFATGVTVMTTRHGAQLAGMSVNSFSALSLEPPLILWSIRNQSNSLPVFRQAGCFAVNVLAADQVEVSNLFAAPAEDRFARLCWSAGCTGAPLLAGAIAHMECTLEQEIDGGDHKIMVGRVAHFARYGGEPLLFTQGRYAVTQEHPGTVQADTAQAPPQPTTPLDPDEGSFMRLLHYTSHQMSAWFDEHREEEGLSVAQFRIYGWLRTQARTLEQLKRLAYLGDRDAADTVADLLERGHIFRDDVGALSLTPSGRQRADASARRVAVFESRLFQGIPEADVAVTRRIMGMLVQRTATP